MDLSFPADAEAFRSEVRAFLAANLPLEWKGLGALDRDDAEAFTNEWRRTIAEHGMPALKPSFYKLDRSADIFPWDPV